MAKIKINNFLISAILILLILQAGLTFLFYWFKTNKEINFISQQLIAYKINFGHNQTKQNLPVHHSYFANKEFYDEAYQQGSPQVKIPDSKVYGGIIPHHLMVKDKIAAFFKGIEDFNYSTVILIGPNHFNNGKSNVILSKASWQTPYGLLEPDLALIDKLAKHHNFAVEENPFVAEHSISGLAPFIRKSLANAKFASIILKNQASQKDCLDLAEAIYKNTDPEKTLIIASIDFSHYQSTLTAEFHDSKSNAVIQNFNFDQIYGLEIDSPPSICAVLKYLKLAGIQKSDLLFSTNSGALLNQLDEPTTSHNIFYFKKGAKTDAEAINFLFFGDIMLDRNVKKKIDEKGFTYLLDNLAGEEKRFFKGIDLIAGNLEGAVTKGGQHYPPVISYDFAFEPEIVKVLKNYNFNFFNLANNHLSDQGQLGIKETRDNLSELGIKYVGCPDGQINKCSYSVITLSNYKISMVGLSMVYSKFNIVSAQKIIEDLSNTTNLVIVNIHWGTEYKHEFSKLQQKIAYSLIDVGADLIIGHHPHVVQGLEIYKEKPIFYSLGNFIFDQYFSADTQEGLAVGASFIIDQKSDQKIAVQLYLFPFKSSFSQVELMKTKDTEEFLQKVISWSQIDNKYIDQIIKRKIDL